MGKSKTIETNYEERESVALRQLPLCLNFGRFYHFSKRDIWGMNWEPNQK